MGQYESKARHHLERIRYYHENAGPRGYAQAEYHYNELARLLMAAQGSKKNKSDAGIIAIFREQAGSLMAEMEKWQDEWKKKEG
jgi:hypothetical protein